MHCQQKKLKDAIDLEDDDLLEAQMSLKEDSPEKHTRWKFPALWDSNPELDDITEPTMHEFFLGVVKNFTLDVMEWASLRKILPSRNTSCTRQNIFPNFICHG